MYIDIFVGDDWFGGKTWKTYTVDIVTALPDESFCPLLLISNISALYIPVSRLVIQPVTIIYSGVYPVSSNYIPSITTTNM